MKSSVSIHAIFLCVLAVPAYCEAPYERDLKQLVEQRDRALAAASAPILERFKIEAEQLLRKATQGGDLDTANRIKAIIGSGTAPTAASDPDGPIKNLKKQLPGTRWIALPSATLRKGLTKTLQFTDKVVEPGGYKYEALQESVVITFTRGDKETLARSKDGRHLEYPKGPAVYELVPEPPK